MNYEVKYDELYDLGDYIEKKDEEIRNIYNEIERLVRSIPEDKNWDGVDYRNYLNSFIGFLQDERKNELQIENLSILLKNVARFYKGNDEDWGTAMRKTVKNPTKKIENRGVYKYDEWGTGKVTNLGKREKEVDKNER